jgi:hypothetical protein
MALNELVDKQSEILFEDDNVLFVKIMGIDAMEHYGSERLVQQYSGYKGRGGEMYLILSKSYNNEKEYFIFEPKYGNPEVSDLDERIYELNDIRKNYPQLMNILTETLGITDTISFLTAVELGREFDSWTLYKYDENIGGIIYNKRRPELSKIIIKFENDDDYFKLFFNDDDLWYVRAANSRYGYSENIFSTDSDYEWNEGYLLNYFSESNSQLLDKIVTSIKPEFFDWRNDEDTKIKMCKFLYDEFDREISNIVSEYDNVRERAGIDALMTDVREYYCNPFTDYQIFVMKDSCFYKYRTWVTHLKELLIENDCNTISELFEKLSENMSKGLRYEPYEYAYHGDFDSDGFNKDVEWSLDKIQQKIEDSPEKYQLSFDDNQKAIKILKKYPMRERHKLEDRGTFVIKKIDKGRIFLTHTDKGASTEKSFSFDEFYNFLNSPELFESIVRKLKKLL